MVTENILMEAAARGGNRQELHERIRQHSHAVTAALKQGETRNDLLNRLRADPAFEAVDFDALDEHARLIGRAPQQVDEFLAQEVAPILSRYRNLLGQKADISF
jgi:adenylosuccinate lyase